MVLMSLGVGEGLTWLYDHQNPDGSWGGFGLEPLTTHEVLATIRALAGENSHYRAGIDWFEKYQPTNLDYQARRVMVGLGSPAKLIGQQNPDGGFGFRVGYSSSILETALALQAIGRCEAGSLAVGYLLSNQGTNGGWGYFSDDQERIFTTCQVLKALYSYKDEDWVNPSIQFALSFLLEHQNPDSGFGIEGSTIYETGLAWEVLKLYQIGEEARKKAYGYLSRRQLANGSWDDDPYLTALALRAVGLGKRPDLAIDPDDIKLSKDRIFELDTVQITANIRNIGDEEAGDIIVRFSIDTTTITLDTIPHLSANDSCEVQTDWIAWGGLHHIGVEIDPFDSISEQNENNNLAYVEVMVEDTIPPETARIWVNNPIFSPNQDGIKDTARVYIRITEPMTLTLTITRSGSTMVTLVEEEPVDSGLFSYPWDGGGLSDGEYLFQAHLRSIGGKTEVLNAFVAIDNNQLPLIEGARRGRAECIRYPDSNLIYPIPSPYNDLIAWISPDSLDWVKLVVTDVERTLTETLAIESIPQENYRWVQWVEADRIGFINGDGLNVVKLTGEKELILSGDIVEYQYSPDHNWIAYVEIDSLLIPHLFLYSPVSTEKMEISPPGNNLSFSENSCYLAYGLGMPGFGAMGIYCLRVGDSTGVKVDDRFAEPIWSENILYFTIKAKDGKEVIGYDPTTGEKSGIVKLPSESGVTISPGKSELFAFISYPARTGIYRIDLKEKRCYFLATSDYGGFTVDNNKNYIFYTMEGRCWAVDRTGEEKYLLADVLKEIGSYPHSPRLNYNETILFVGIGNYGTAYLNNQDNLSLGIKRLTRRHPAPDVVRIEGEALDRYFEKYRIEYATFNSPNNWQLIEENQFEAESLLGLWLPPKKGNYLIRVKGWDRGGNQKSDLDTLIWDQESSIANLKIEPKIFSPTGRKDTIPDSCLISYELLSRQPVIIKIVDKDNHLKRVFYQPETIPGEYSVVWDGRDYLGEIVPDEHYHLLVEQAEGLVTVDTSKPEVSIEFSERPPKGPSMLWYHVKWPSWIIEKNIFQVLYAPYKLFSTIQDITLIEYNIEWSRDDTTWFLVEKGFDGDTVETLLSGKAEDLVGTNLFRTRAQDYFHRESVDKTIDTLPEYYVAVKNIREPFRDRIYIRAAYYDLRKVEVYYKDTNGSWVFLGVPDTIPGFSKTFFAEYSIPSHLTSHWLMTKIIRESGIKIDSGEVRIIEGHGGPILYISSPSDSDTVFGEVEVVATAGGFTPEVVDFYLHRNSLNYYLGADSSYPFSIQWDTRAFPDGWYYLYPDTPDPPPNLKIEGVHLYIQNCLPQVLLKNPTNYSWVKDSILLQANAYPAPGSQSPITKVGFQYETQTGWETIGEDPSPPYEADFDTRILDDGSHHFRAYAVDAQGMVGYSRINTYHIDNTPPTAEIDYPLSGQQFENVDSIAVVGTGADTNLYFRDPIRLQYRRFGTNRITFLSLDSSIVSDTFGFWPTRELESGDYWLYLRVEDKAHSISQDSVDVRLVNDDPAPKVKIIQPEPEAWVKEEIPVLGEVDDSNLDLWRLEYACGSGWKLITEGSSPASGTLAVFDTRNVPDGPCSLRLWARDLNNRRSEDLVIIYIDNSPPQVSITFPEDLAYLARPFPLLIDVDEPYPETSYVELGKSHKPTVWTTVVGYSGLPPTDTAFVFDPLPGIGDFSIRFTVSDSAGNLSLDTIRITIDTLPPAKPEGLAASDSGPNISLTWFRNREPDLAGYYLYENGIRITDSVLIDTNYLRTVTQGGRYVYQVSALDLTNLESERSDSVVVMIDLEPPVVKITSPPSGGRISGRVEVIGSAYDREGNFREYIVSVGKDSNPSQYYEIDHGYEPVYFGPLATWDTDTIDSFWTIKLWASDTLDNEDSAKVLVFIDHEPPPRPESLKAEVATDTVTLTWHKLDCPDLWGYRIYKDGILVNPEYPWPETTYQMILPDGLYTFEVSGVDSAKNEGEHSDTAMALIDTKPPHAVITQPADSEKISGKVLIAAECDDNDVEEVLFFSLDTIGVDSTPPWSIYWDTDTLAEGPYPLLAIATDFHGNTDPDPDSILVIVVKDNIPPEPPRGLSYELLPDSILLTWFKNKEHDLLGYHLYKDSVRITSSPVADTFYLDDRGDTSVIYQVSAVDSAENESDLSDPIFVDLDPPSITVTRPSSGQIIGKRCPVVGTITDNALRSYILEWSTEPPDSWRTIASGSTDIYDDTIGIFYPDSSRSYRLRILAVDTFDLKDSNDIIVSADLIPPPPPQNFTAKLLPDTTIELTWQPPQTGDLYGYNVYIGYDPNHLARLNEDVIFDTFYIYDHPRPGETYYFAATGLDTLSNESEYSNRDSVVMPDPDIDLAFSSFYVIPEIVVVGAEARCLGRVENRGTETAYRVEIAFFVRGIEGIGTVVIDSIPGGSDEPFELTFTARPEYLGIDTIDAVVDPDDVIKETNEENNYAEDEIRVIEEPIILTTTIDSFSYLPTDFVNLEVRIENLMNEDYTGTLSFIITDSSGIAVDSILDGIFWVEDTLPECSQFGPWVWDTAIVYKGKKAHTDSYELNLVEHRFSDAEPITIGQGWRIIQYVHIDTSTREIMLEFMDSDSSRDHRVFWGEDLINRPGRIRLGDLPDTGWQRLEFDAAELNLTDVVGISYINYGGRVYWDHSGFGVVRLPITLPAGSDTFLDFSWPVQAPPGRYELKTSFANFLSIDTFQILPLGSLLVSIRPDRGIYYPYQLARFYSRIENQTSRSYHDLLLRISIVTPAQETLKIDSLTDEVLLPKEVIEHETEYQLGPADPGYYRLVNLTQTAETTIIADTGFIVNPIGGSGISGWIDCEPSVVIYPDSVRIDYLLKNMGNQPLEKIEVRVPVIAPSEETVHIHLDTCGLNIGEVYQDSFLLGSVGLKLNPYKVLLFAAYRGTTNLVAYDGFEVVDGVPPQFLSSGPEGLISGTVRFFAEVVDSHSGVKTVRLTIIDTTNLSLESGDSLHGIWARFINTAQIPDGGYDGVFTAVDHYGNRAEDTIRIRIDNTPPEIIISGVEPDSLYRHPVAAIIEITEPNLLKKEILLNGIPYQSGDTIADEGDYELTVYAEDSLGHSADTAVFFGVDFHPPRITITGVENGGIYNHPVTPFITIIDAHPDTEMITLNGEEYKSGTPIYDEGVYTLYIWAKDRADNESDTGIVFIIDLTPPPPPAVIEPPESSTVTVNSISILGQAQGKVVELAGSLSATIAGIENGRFQFSDIWLKPHWNDFRLYATDSAGNRSQAEEYSINYLPAVVEIEITTPKLPVPLDGLETDSAMTLLRSNNYNIFISESLDLEIGDEIGAAGYPLIPDSSWIDSVFLPDWNYPGGIKRLRVKIDGKGRFLTTVSWKNISPVTDSGATSQLQYFGSKDTTLDLRLLGDTGRIEITSKVYCRGIYHTFLDTTLLIVSDLDSIPEIVVKERKDLERWIARLIDEYHQETASRSDLPILIRWLEWRWYRW